FLKLEINTIGSTSMRRIKQKKIHLFMIIGCQNILKIVNFLNLILSLKIEGIVEFIVESRSILVLSCSVTVIFNFFCNLSNLQSVGYIFLNVNCFGIITICSSKINFIICIEKQFCIKKIKKKNLKLISYRKK